MQHTYWNKQGAHQAEYDRLVQLVPAMGNCDTVAGELIRAVGKLGHDFYNNGMGNNTSGAVNFLEAKGAIDRNTYRTIYDYTRGALYQGNYDGDSLQVAMEHMVDQTIEFILANPELETQANSEDMFEYSEEEQNFCEECEDELDDRYSSICRYCEEAYEEEYDEDDCYA